jgi:hypothetical protein
MILSFNINALIVGAFESSLGSRRMLGAAVMVQSSGKRTNGA